MKMHNRDEKIQCTAVILAGGQSRRMGRDKRFLTFEGESFIERMFKLASCFAKEVIISLATEEQAETIHTSGNFKVVLDENPGKGPAYALISAAKNADYEYLAVMPVDSPLLEPELYHLLMREVKGYDAAVPLVNRMPEPLHAVYSKQSLLARASEAEPGSMNALLSLLNVNFVEEEKLRIADPEMLSFLNINTPEDYKKLREKVKTCR
jgi:molybdopterin-guanine dinucleotide biosynthesis protein A